MVYPDGFPLLGFPNESNEESGQWDTVYRCHLADARIVLWRCAVNRGFAVNIYRINPDSITLTSFYDRFDPKQEPITVEDAFEAQLAINYLFQKYLPKEVIDDVSSFS